MSKSFIGGQPDFDTVVLSDSEFYGKILGQDNEVNYNDDDIRLHDDNIIPNQTENEPTQDTLFNNIEDLEPEDTQSQLDLLEG